MREVDAGLETWGFRLWLGDSLLWSTDDAWPPMFDEDSGLTGVTVRRRVKLRAWTSVSQKWTLPGEKRQTGIYRDRASS